MLKKIVVSIVLAMLVLSAGCSKMPVITGADQSISYQITRKAELAGKWQVYQIKIELAEEDEIPILLTLANGDKADGYFYLESGDNVEFTITANSLLYKSEALDKNNPGRVSSDRFSFTASQAQGGTYMLKFRSTERGDKAKATIFLEVVYPSSGSVYIPLETK